MFRFSPPLQHHLVSKFRKECSSFEALPDAAGDIDQLRWWQTHQEQFPLLSYLARVVFVLPAAVALSGWGKSDAVGGKGEAEDI